jgi:hypothetical protein
MKNGTQSSNRLTLVDDSSSDQVRVGSTRADVTAADAALDSHSTGDMAANADNPLKDLLQNKALFAVVSVACFTAAVAAGSYSIWLSRRKVAHEAFTSVSDLLTTCHNRMSQMENDLKSLSRVRSA